MTAPADPRPLADRAEDALIAADLTAHAMFGPDETRWTDAQVDDYLGALNTAHAAFAESVTSGLTESYDAFEARMTAEELRERIAVLELVAEGLLTALNQERKRNEELTEALSLQGTLLGISRALDEGYEQSLFTRLQLGRHEGDTP